MEKFTMQLLAYCVSIMLIEFMIEIGFNISTKVIGFAKSAFDHLDLKFMKISMSSIWGKKNDK